MIEDRELDQNFLLDEIRMEACYSGDLTGCSPLSERILDAVRKVPRHAFVPEDIEWAAYKNTALPIGHRQTISQPYIVALMTHLIDPQPEDIVLEIGTGSGYQAAVLSCLVKQVYSLEIIDELAEKACARLRHLGFTNVEVRTGNGHLGWLEHAPYDAIIVTAAAERIPLALIEQVKPDGIMVIPVGKRGSAQALKILRKDDRGRIKVRSVLPVIFVPLTGSTEIQEAGI